MSAQLTPYVSFGHFEQLREAREILRWEAQTLNDVASRLDTEFCRAVDLLVASTGSVIVTGIGKAGLIGRKIAATLASTGTRSQFVHPVEALHGDLGCIGSNDVVLALSNSGETEEVNRLLTILRELEVRVIAITARETSTLGRNSDIVLTLGQIKEVGQLGLAPTASTTAMLALGDALALVASRARGFSRHDFALRHPGGNLGRQLQHVTDVMRTGDQLRIAAETATIREVFVDMRRPGRRTGAVMLVDDRGRLSGLFTDSDLVRLLEARREDQLDRPISQVMTRSPRTTSPDAPLTDAVGLLQAHRISELPVIDSEGRPVGLVDITDLIGLVPEERAE